MTNSILRGLPEGGDVVQAFGTLGVSRIWFVGEHLLAHDEPR